MGQTTDPNDRGFQIADCGMWSSGRHMAFYPVHWHKLNQINRAPNYAFLYITPALQFSRRCREMLSGLRSGSYFGGVDWRSC